MATHCVNFCASSKLSSSSQTKVEKKWLGFTAPDRKLKNLKLSTGCRARAAVYASSVPIEMPRQWYNLIADLPIKPPPPLHPKTHEPVKPEDLSHLFPDELIKQEASGERYIDIPAEVIDIYKLRLLGPRDWRSFLTCQREFITSMKVEARLDHTNPTLQFHKCIIMQSKALRRL